MISDIASLCVSPQCSIRDGIAGIDRGEKGIVLVTNERQQLLGTVTDGDVRRAVLAGVGLDLPISKLLERKATVHAKSVTAPLGTSRAELRQIMRKAVIRHLPLLDSQERVVDLVSLDELVPDLLPPLQAIVMAGGFGERLKPLTNDIPKPMLPVGDQPLLERTISQLKEVGIRQINISTHFKPKEIESHFGDGRDFGVRINYVCEDRPLGTAGALGLMETGDIPILLINGDILTSVDFKAMHVFHDEHGADLTVGVRQYDFRVPYGVMECQGANVTSVSEKPQFEFFVNAGIYLLEPNVRRFIPQGEPFDMTDLMKVLIAEGRRVVGFPIIEYWLDIGQLADYEQAQEDIKNGKLET